MKNRAANFRIFYSIVRDRYHDKKFSLRFNYLYITYIIIIITIGAGPLIFIYKNKI